MSGPKTHRTFQSSTRDKVTDYKYKTYTNKELIEMASVSTIGKEQISTPAEIAPKTAALDEFKAGIVRSMVQYNAGLVKTFDNVDDLLADLHSPE